MKKAQEWRHLRRVIELSGDFPPTEPVANESPDFIFGGEVRTGVELTEYVRGLASPSVTARKIEYLHNHVAFEARRLFEAQHHIPLWVTIQWNIVPGLNKRLSRKLASQLASLVAQAIPEQPLGSTRIDGVSHPGIEVLDSIPIIQIVRLKPGSRGGWATIEAGFVSVEVPEIQAILDKKEALVAQYLRQCDRVWLVVVADGNSISSMADFAHDGEGFATSFDRVYFYDGAAERVFRIK